MVPALTWVCIVIAMVTYCFGPPPRPPRLSPFEGARGLLVVS